MIFSSRVAVAVSLCGAAFVLAGCGGGDQFDTAPVSGTVKLNGQPVTEGTVMLSPITEGDTQMAGKGAAAPIQEDGTFELTTYDQGDGAVIGKHKVAYVAPMTTKEVPAGAHGSNVVQSSYQGAHPTVTEVEITDGDNTLKIELTK